METKGKEVIIDGVNVAECEYFDDADCFNPAETVLSCEAEKNCLYKQLKRAKAELEQYKKSKQASYEAMQIERNNAVNENRLLRAALKNKNFVAIVEENKNLKKALEEIKEIAKLHQYFNPEILEIKGNIGQIQDLKMTEIYEKCKEVLEDK